MTARLGPGRRAAAAAVAAWLTVVWAQPARDYFGQEVRGEALLHGLPTDQPPAYSMPVPPVLDALATHAGPRVERAAPAVLDAAVVALLMALGWLAAGGPAGLCAGLLALAGPLRNSATPPVEGVLYLIVALAAAAAAARWSPRRGALLGVAVGVALLAKSPLFALPPLLAAWDLRRSRGQPARRRALSALALGALPYAGVLAWSTMTWRLYGRFVLFEDGRATYNVVSGALGLVPTIDGNLGALAPLPRGSGSPIGWALAYVAAHPLAYLSACAARAWYALSFRPWLAAAAALGAALAWRRPAARAAALLAVYLLAVLCSMPIEDRYLEPLWLWAAALAAAVPARLLARGAKGASFGWLRQDEPAPTARPALACLVPPALVAALAVVLALAYPWRVESFPERADAAVARWPRDAAVRSARGRLLMARERYDEAAADFETALALRPSADRALNLDCADFARRAALRPIHPLVSTGRDRRKAHLLRAFAAAEGGLFAQARAELEAAGAAAEDAAIVRRVSTELERRTLERLRAAPNPAPRALTSCADWLPAERLHGLSAPLRRARPGDPTADELAAWTPMRERPTRR